MKLLSQQDQIDQVVVYITKLREKVDDLKKRKEVMASSISSSGRSDHINDQNSLEIEIPIVKVREIGSSLEVIIISGKKRKFSVQEIIRILEEGGAEVITASTSIVGLHIFHIFHAQVTVLPKPFIFQTLHTYILLK
ncbi:hypothetical protein M9H77_04691 [Catharanthus roseus]|uniref:Uncharacterized protein n=1 Tax=Catharanthus roseus TaxID=4058 RepID=A0ACC0CF74_CATRO|nr:hypothetical protein M9H77_04691 [Catharanthus roseus]